MQNQKTEQFTARGTRRGFLALLPGMAVAPLVCLKAKADDNQGDDQGDNDQGATRMRWDLVHFDGTHLSAGGTDSAKAADGSQISLTGAGTFLANPGEGEAQAVSGGGTWQTFDSTGAANGNGDYRVTRLVAYDEVPGARPAVGTVDEIGDAEDSRAGLLVLRVLYSDGEEGVLTISCHGGGPPPAAPNSVFEGITTTKGFVGYVDRGKPAPGVDANRTAFHVLH
jgi:hypothetical protein